jgi:glycosyltransferase involved in cell wall biosynthesis
VPRILFVTSRRSSFITVDRELLAQSYEVRDLHQPGRWSSPLRVLRAMRGCDAVVGWWASWHTFWPITLAWLLRRPSALIVGGFDTANEPEIGYGYQRGGARALLSRWIMRRAGVLATNSAYSQREVQRNVNIGPERVTVMHHGVPDPFGALPDKPDAPLVLTVGLVDRPNLERKGQRAFVEAARELPDVAFVLAGRFVDDAGERLRAQAPSNVRLTGWADDEELLDLYRRAGAYVQASLHEGFGVSVAEAMLAGAVPVVTRAGALPEVVGDVGVQVDAPAEPRAVAAAIREALGRGPDSRAAARQRVLREFSLDARAAALRDLVDRALAGR